MKNSAWVHSPKDYATETDIIEIPDALYAPGAYVKYKGNFYTAENFSWNTLKRTWTYFLVRGNSAHDGITEIYEGLEEVPEVELSTV